MAALPHTPFLTQSKPNQGTRVRLRHTGLAAYPEIAQAYQGWPRMLSWLQAFMERGETVAMRKPATMT
jgi:hypothetical protein